MANTPRIPTADTKRRPNEPSRWPVLARLPDVSAELTTERTTRQPAAGNIGYRFDPPQAAGRQQKSEIRNPKSEIASDGRKTSQPPQPHLFERGRAQERTARLPRRESPILPTSNPFTIPRKGLINSLAPVVRFVTLVVLFTAAGTWIQLNGRHNTPANGPVDPPKTAAQQPVEPAANAADQPIKAPTAAGPVGTTPQAGARVGRARENDDFASARSVSGSSEESTAAAGGETAHLAGADGSSLPRVQTAEPQGSGVGEDPALGSEPNHTPEVAQLPGFIIEIPAR